MSECNHRDRIGSTILEPRGIETSICYRCGAIDPEGRVTSDDAAPSDGSTRIPPMGEVLSLTGGLYLGGFAMWLHESLGFALLALGLVVLAVRDWAGDHDE